MREIIYTGGFDYEALEGQSIRIWTPYRPLDNYLGNHFTASTALAECPHASFACHRIGVVAQHEFWNRRALRTVGVEKEVA